MNLFIDAHLFDGPGQGTKTYLKGLYGSLIKNNTDTQFFLASSKPDRLASEFPESQNVHYIQYSSTNKYVRLSWGIPMKIRKYNIDVAHFQYISPAIKSCYEVLTIHDLLFMDFPDHFPSKYKFTRNYLFERSARRADCITTVSAYSKETLVRHYKIAEDKIAVTPNGVLDLYWENQERLIDIRTKYGVSQFILYVSRFEPRKNQVGLLRAYCKLKLWKEQIQVVFIGSLGIASVEFTKLYNSLDQKIRSQIIILEDINFEELKAFYSTCLLFVYPSFAEGFGIPPLEAAVCGANVICSNTTAMSEFDFFEDQLFDPHNEKEVQDKITYFLNHPPHPDKKRLVRELIRKRYNWELSAEIFWNKIAGL